VRLLATYLLGYASVAPLLAALLDVLLEQPILKISEYHMAIHRAPKELNPKAVSELGRQKILQTWIKSGIEDFYLSFELEERWHRHSTFYCHQGLEKICKNQFTQHFL
jgi:hypothetical protein